MPEPKLDIEKTVSSSTVLPGATVTHTLTVTNLGTSPSDAYDLKIEDLLADQDLTLVDGSVTASRGTVIAGKGAGDTTVRVEVGGLSSIGGDSHGIIIDDRTAFESLLGSNSLSTITEQWAVDRFTFGQAAATAQPALAIGESMTITFDAVVSGSAPNGDVVNNTANVSGDDIDGVGGTAGTDVDAIGVTVASNASPVIDLDGDDSSGVANSGYQTTFISGIPIAIADTDTLITDPGDTNIESATITLNNPQTGDFFSVGTLPVGITASAYDSTTGQITLNGSATLADYQSAIAAINYDNSATSSDTTTRTVEVQVTNAAGAASNIANTTIRKNNHG